MPSALLYTGPDLDHLHRDIARSGSVDTQAPVRAAAEQVIAAAPQRVWEVLSDVAGWPEVIGDVRSAELDGPVAVDRAFRWNNAGTRIRSRFAVVRPGAELTWTGQAMGTRAVHRNTLVPHDGGTLLRSEESLAGFLLSVLMPSHKLEAGLRRFVRDIATAAER